VLELVGDGQILFGSDMPHGDRERFAANMLQERKEDHRIRVWVIFDGMCG
jgi:hypothetical protein